MTVAAEYVSRTDIGEIRTECKIDLSASPPFVSEVELADDDFDFLESEYVELRDGTCIETFVTEDGRTVDDGIALD